MSEITWPPFNGHVITGSWIQVGFEVFQTWVLNLKERELADTALTYTALEGFVSENTTLMDSCIQFYKFTSFSNTYMQSMWHKNNSAKCKLLP